MSYKFNYRAVLRALSVLAICLPLGHGVAHAATVTWDPACTSSGAYSTAALDVSGNLAVHCAGGGGGSVPSIQFNPASVSVTEGATATVTITRTGLTTGTDSVDVSVTGGTATVIDDYNAFAPQTVTFAPNETSKTISIGTVDDATPELTETILLALGNPSATVVLGTASATVNILDNDTMKVLFQPTTIPAVTEGLPITVTVVRTGPTGAGATVDVSVSGGTATPVSDYTFTSPTTVTFIAGETSKTISVPTIDDAVVESPETIVFGLANPTGAIIDVAASSATATINDNDSAACPAYAGTIGDFTSFNLPGTAPQVISVAANTTAVYKFKINSAQFPGKVKISASPTTATNGTSYKEIYISTCAGSTTGISPYCQMTASGSAVTRTLNAAGYCIIPRDNDAFVTIKTYTQPAVFGLSSGF